LLFCSDSRPAEPAQNRLFQAIGRTAVVNALVVDGSFVEQG
jgi:hypothetical protein